MTNILIVTTDDQRYDELAYMPNTRRLLGQGTSFVQCRGNVPLCSPARTAIISGQNSKHHGVVLNTNNPSSTIYNGSTFVALNNAGYRVGAIGKFLTGLAAIAVKPGFDFWRCMSGSHGPSGLIYDAFGYEIFDGTSTLSPTPYQDHYLAGQAIDFMRGSEPWCLWYCPTSNHWPLEAPPNHQTEWAHRDHPVTYETDVSDKPSWIQALPAIDAVVAAEIQAEERLRLRELLTVDDAVGAMVAMIDGTGLADDTTIILTSDNGNMLGEHRLVGGAGARVAKKNTVYDGSMHVPLIARGPGFPHQKVTVPTTHADVAATTLDIANASPILPNQAGTSLLDIAATPSAYATRHLLHHRANDGDGFPTTDGISNATRKLWRHQGQTDPNKYELYDLANDPDELVNRAYAGGTWLTERNALEVLLNALLA